MKRKDLSNKELEEFFMVYKLGSKDLLKKFSAIKLSKYVFFLKYITGSVTKNDTFYEKTKEHTNEEIISSLANLWRV